MHGNCPYVASSSLCAIIDIALVWNENEQISNFSVALSSQSDKKSSYKKQRLLRRHRPYTVRTHVVGGLYSILQR